MPNLFTNSTAVYPNRIEDKYKLESELNLQEFGHNDVEFRNNRKLIAVGYERVVYGDHGPYIEFARQHMKCKLYQKFGGEDAPEPKDLPSPHEAKFYYLWLKPEHSNLKIYLQIKSVHDLKNAPMRDDGKPSRFNRKEGYADYRRGMYYINPYTLDIMYTKYFPPLID